MMKLENLRSAIQKYLDDDGTRWSVGTDVTLLDPAAEVDRAIKYGLFQAVRFFTKHGGENILIQKEFTTDTLGQVSLGDTEDDMALWIASVAFQETPSVWVSGVSTRADEVEYTSMTPRTIRVNFIPEPYIKAIPPVVGPPAVPAYGEVRFLGEAQLEIPELQILSILYAVRTLIPRDNEQNLALNDAIFQAENSIASITETPLAVSFPGYGRSARSVMRYKWAFIRYDAKTQKKNVIQIHRPLFSFFDVVA